MVPKHFGRGLRAVVLAGSLIFLGLQSARGAGAKYGRLTGVVADPQGDPLLGATVLVTGSVALPSPSNEIGATTVGRVITDARGKFAFEHLLPGWYSLRVTSPTRVPALRNGVRVEAGQTATEWFVLADIFAPLGIQVSKSTSSSSDDNWKWVLRTSAATRPILRYQQEQEVAEAAPQPSRGPSQRLIGMLPGPARSDPLADDPGLGSVVAYLHPLSDNSDLLIVGTNANGVQASSVATAFRKNLVRGDPQELSLVVHQFSISDGVPMPWGYSQNPLAHAQGAVVSYTRTHRLSPGLTLTAGMEVNGLNAGRSVMTVQPNLKLDYQVDAQTVVALQYGNGRPDSFATMLERVGMLNTFPRITVSDYRPRLEQLNHAEVSLHHRLSKSSRVELAAYHDALHNAAVWGSGHVGGTDWLAGDLLPYPASMYGVILNAGGYQAAGFRAVYSQDLGKYFQAAVAYSSGDALTARGAASSGSALELEDLLRAAQTDALAGKVSVLTPVTHTELTTSYERVPQGLVTFVDPYGQANLQLQPYLGMQIRQPIPALSFLSARIEALADCQNLLAQGYVPLARPGEKVMLLSSAYRSFRGGFSVQF